MKYIIKMPFVLRDGRAFKRGQIVECKKGDLPAEFIEELKEEKPKAVKRNAGNRKARP